MGIEVGHRLVKDFEQEGLGVYLEGDFSFGNPLARGFGRKKGDYWLTPYLVGRSP